MSLAIALNRRQFILLGGALTILCATLLWHYPNRIRSVDLGVEYGQPSWLGEKLSPACNPGQESGTGDLASKPLRRRNIAIASTFGFHHDVYLALAWTMERVMNSTEGKVQVYANTPFGFDFQDIVEALGLYHGSVKKPDDLVLDVARQTEDRGIDMIVLGTCEVDLRGDWHHQLLAAWDARDDDQKFQIVCIVHHVLDKAWQPRIADWSRRSAIRLLPISAHVGEGFRESFNELADSFDPKIRSAGYEYIPIDVHVPILDIPNLPEVTADKVLSKAVIQGSFNTERRDYIHLFDDLLASLAEDPSAWGYLPLAGHASYVADPSNLSPFHLYLVGSGSLEVPKELQNIVSIHINLDYSAFYALMGVMDICIPAFAENGYYEHQASSTFVMALECNVPILVTQRMRRSYTYADNDRVIVTRPAAVREIAAIKALRTNNATDLSYILGTSGGGDRIEVSPHVEGAVQEMMKKSWIRPKFDFQHFKDKIWRENELIVQRLLKDM